MAGSHSRKRSRRWIVIPGCLFLAFFGLTFLYFAVYFRCSEVALGRTNVRIFRSRWLMHYYEPAVRIESLVGKPTKLVYVPAEFQQGP